jgi:dsRNA-specific ribonuclease
VDEARIDKEMHELEGILAYTFHDIAQLSRAMHSVLLEKREGDGKNNQEYANDALACLGDTVIKYLIARYLFDQEKRKGEITSEKIKLEGNEVLHKITTEYHIIDYAYNDKHFVKDDPPQHEKQAGQPSFFSPSVSASGAFSCGASSASVSEGVSSSDALGSGVGSTTASAVSDFFF